jgi:hypothetical protein
MDFHDATRSCFGGKEDQFILRGGASECSYVILILVANQLS